MIRLGRMASYAYWLSIVGLYACIRLLFLTRLPIFNDEAIYLQWGWREVHVPGQLFYSLFDGKQPLLMWLYGICTAYGSDPLWIARSISALTGLLTLSGLFVLGRKYFSPRIALFAAIVYTCVPIFVFFDRQALMESVMSAVGIWSLIVTLQVRHRSWFGWAICLGILWALGFWIKSTIVLFVIASLFVLLLSGWRYISRILLAFGVAEILLIPLFWQHDAIVIWTRNDRFTLGLQELLQLPWHMWLGNFSQTTILIFVYLTPIAALLSLFGMWRIWRTNRSAELLCMIWTVVLILLFVVTIRSPNPRYLVALLPMWCIWTAVGLDTLFRQSRRVGWFMLGSMVISSLTVSAMLVADPQRYFSIAATLTSASQQEEYVTGWPSGYGVLEALRFIKMQHPDEKIDVWTRADWGNPESGIAVYFRSDPLVEVFQYEEARYSQYYRGASCTRKGRAVYYVSRDDSTIPAQADFQMQARFEKPRGKHFVAVYALQKPCL